MAGDLVAGEYKLVRLIGRGGMGEVHEAIELSTGRRVAIKLLTFIPSTGDDDPNRKREVTTRFYREARATKSIESLHVVEILDAGADSNGRPFIAMEFLTGEDLQQVLKRTTTLSVQTAVRVTAQAALGLAKAHAAGIVHRDIKPANLFLAKQENSNEVVVKLVDFGIARLQNGDDEGHDLTQDLTRTGSMLGSPTYMAPEQARGLKSIDGRVDVWSLGIVLYKMLTGTTPHERGDGGLGELLIRICVVPAPSVQERAPWVPPELAKVVHRALKLNPNERFSSAQELYDALTPLLAGGELRLDDSLLAGASDAERSFVAPKADISNLSITRPGIALTGVDDPSADQTRYEMSGSEAPAPRRRAPVAWLAAGGLAIAVGLGLGLGRFAGQPTPQVTPTGPAISPPPSATQEPAQVEQHVVYVRITPQKAMVTLDGIPLSINADSTLELKGPLGKTFTIVASHGTRVETRTVAITKHPLTNAIVAMPDALDVSPPKAAPAPRPNPGRGTGAAPAPTPTPTQTNTPSLRPWGQ